MSTNPATDAPRIRPRSLPEPGQSLEDLHPEIAAEWVGSAAEMEIAERRTVGRHVIQSELRNSRSVEGSSAASDITVLPISPADCLRQQEFSADDIRALLDELGRRLVQRREAGAWEGDLARWGRISRFHAPARDRSPDRHALRLGRVRRSGAPMPVSN